MQTSPRLGLWTIALLGIYSFSESKVLFYEDFESGGYSQWEGGSVTKEGAGLIIEKGNTRKGQYAAHFTCDSCTRSELTSGATNFDWGKEYWVGFSLYLPVLPTGNKIINQHHSVPGNENWNCIAGPNSFTLHINGSGNLRVLTSTSDANVDSTPPKGDATWGTEALHVETAKTNVWYDFVLHFIYQPNTSGLMEVWINKTKVITNNGPTVYLKDLCGVEKEHYQYLKVGLYLGGGSGEIYYDEIRVGDASSSLSEMSPAGGNVSTELGIKTTAGIDVFSVSPNPFKSAATFQFSGGAPEKVSVFDLRGKLVYAGYPAPGARSVSWNGVDAEGHPMATGVYVVSMTVGRIAVKKQITLIR